MHLPTSAPLAWAHSTQWTLSKLRGNETQQPEPGPTSRATPSRPDPSPVSAGPRFPSCTNQSSPLPCRHEDWLGECTWKPQEPRQTSATLQGPRSPVLGAAVLHAGHTSLLPRVYSSHVTVTTCRPPYHHLTSWASSRVCVLALSSGSDSHSEVHGQRPPSTLKGRCEQSPVKEVAPLRPETAPLPAGAAELCARRGPQGTDCYGSSPLHRAQADVG